MKSIINLVVLILAATVLAGCAEGGAPAAPVTPSLDVTDTTGCIRGVVVDQAIVPVAGAKVVILPEGTETMTDESGLFVVCDLLAGSYFIDVSKPIYQGTQSSAEVTAGDENPASIKIQISRIPGLTPYLDTAQFDGFYECAFATVFITDSCDFAVRTAHDEGATAVPRNIQNNDNTMYAIWSEDNLAVVQEAWWDGQASNTFRSSLQDTPIANDCDCSTKHMEAAGSGGYIFDRMDKDDLKPKNTSGTQTWPSIDDLEDGAVAIRGFIPFQDLTGVDYAIDLEFQIFTTFFHSYTPDPDWTFETKGDFTVPE